MYLEHKNCILPPFPKSRNAMPQSTMTRSLRSFLRMMSRRHLQETDVPNQVFLLYRNGGSISVQITSPCLNQIQFLCTGFDSNRDSSVFWQGCILHRLTSLEKTPITHQPIDRLKKRNQIWIWGIKKLSI